MSSLLEMCADVVAEKDKQIADLQDRVDKLERALIDSDLELRVCYKALELANVNVVEYLEQAKEMMKSE